MSSSNQLRSNLNDKRSNSSFAQTNSNSVNNNLRQNSKSAKVITENKKASEENYLLNKEEEYKRLNAELEKKTATLVFEAEQVLKANEKLLNEADYLDKITDVNFLHTDDDRITSSNLDIPRKKNVTLSSTTDINSFKRTIKQIESNKSAELENEFENEEKQNEELFKFKTNKQKLQLNNDYDEEGDLIIPQTANEMSNEAQIRFLKAKLKVLQEEIDRYSTELNKRDEENLKLAQRCKELDEDRAKQLRISNAHQTQMDKYKKLNDELQVKVQHYETQSLQIKKENDQFKRDSKKTQVDQQQLELRLNRALEEIEKLKIQLQKTTSNTKDSSEQDKKRIEHMQLETKRLQKQKQELIQAFKKQLKLIDILKKQKMHLEAARMLQFSEEEFINALEWNNNSAVNITHNSANQQNSNRGGNSHNTSATNGSSRRPPISTNSANNINGSLIQKKKNLSNNELNLSINGQHQQNQSQLKPIGKENNMNEKNKPTLSNLALNNGDEEEENNELALKKASNINDINYDDDPLFYYEQNKSINFMKRFQDDNEETHQNHLNEIETTLNSMNMNQQKQSSFDKQLDLDFMEDENESVKHYSHLDNLNYEDFNDDNENLNDEEKNDDEDDLTYFNLNK